MNDQACLAESFIGGGISSRGCQPKPLRNSLLRKETNREKVLANTGVWSRKTIVLIRSITFPMNWEAKVQLQAPWVYILAGNCSLQSVSLNAYVMGVIPSAYTDNCLTPLTLGLNCIRKPCQESHVTQNCVYKIIMNWRYSLLMQHSINWIGLFSF